MTILSFDLASGGISAALFNSKLEVLRSQEAGWDVAIDEKGEATLSLEEIVGRFKHIIRGLNITESLDAIIIGTLMHNCVLLDASDQPLTAIFTWLDRRGAEGINDIRQHLGDSFHERTGCHYHPTYPVFKLATLRLNNSSLLPQTARVVSIKSFLVHALTDVWTEDYGMASASGLFGIRDNNWDTKILNLLSLDPKTLPPISSRAAIVGQVTSNAAKEYGLPAGATVFNGSGDGFFAHLGSECEASGKMSVSLGTSAVTRQNVSAPVLNKAAGTFCYVADEGAYLLGCAGNNGGNVLKWGRSIFGELRDAGEDIPIFIPLLHGERSPEWNSLLKGSWHDLTAQHSAAHLARSVLEGVIFNLAYFADILRKTSNNATTHIVLSGNGFLQPLAAPMLAAVVDVPVWMPLVPGLASLRGAALCAMQALGGKPPEAEVTQVFPIADAGLQKRFSRYLELRLAL